MKTRDYLKYFVPDCLWKMLFVSNLLRICSLKCLTILITLRPLTEFYPKIKATKLQKTATITLN